MPPASQRQPAGPSVGAAAISLATRPAHAPPPRQARGTPVVKEAPGTSTQALTVGTRLAVLWTHGWENGTVIEVTVGKGSRRFTVAYDDGEFHDEDLLNPEEWRILEGDSLPLAYDLPSHARRPAEECRRNAQCTIAAGHKGFCNKRRCVEQTLYV